MHKHKDYTGCKFGKLTVIEYVIEKQLKNKWLCKCDCGNEVLVTVGNLNSGNTKSCGCLRKEIMRKKQTTHGQRRTRLYYIHRGMIKRCNSEKSEQYKNYGGRGIKVCNEWYDFECFYKWSHENGYKEDLKIDRIDNNIGYCPENCKWSTNLEQANNQRTNVMVGDTNLTLSQYCRENKIKYNDVIRLRCKNKSTKNLIPHELHKRG